MRVFISYRRDDSMVTAALLHKELAGRADFADAFMDIDDIGYGDDFVTAIDTALHQADVVLVVIGPRWLELLTARVRGDDWVRHEVATALRMREPGAARQRPLRVLPVLVGGAAPPPEAALPDELKALARVGMLKLDERALKASVNTLLEALQEENFEGKVRRLQEEQNERRRRMRARIASLAVASALFLAFSLNVFDLLGFGPRVATTIMLLAHIAAPAPPWSGEVVLVAIDAESERAVGRKFDPSWRSEHAAVIQRAASAAARTVAFDMVLEDPAPAAANASLQEALAAMHDKMPVVFGVQNRGADGNDVMLAQFAALARKGVACAGLALGQAQLMPLAAHRADVPGRRDDTGSSASRAPADAAPQGAEMNPSFALAAYGGGGRVEAVEGTGKLVVRVRPQRRTQSLDFYKVETLESPQPGCDALAAGDKVYSQLIDPYDLPALREAPQRIAYERVLAGDPGALALLKDRIVVVGTMLPGLDRIPMPWPADDRWGVELHAAHVDAIARHVAIRPLRPITEWLLMSGAALLGALVAHRLRERPRVLKIAALVGIALVWIAVSIARYRAERQLIGVPYDIAALALGAWLANRTWRRIPA